MSYRDAFTREKYGQTPRPQADVRRDFRGPAPDGRPSGPRMGDRPTLEQRRDIPGRDRTAVDFDRPRAASTNHRSLAEHRMNPSMSGRTSMDKIQESPIVVERLGTRQPQKTDTTFVYRGTTKLARKAPDTTNPSSSYFNRATQADRGGITGLPQRTETTNQVSGRGMTNQSRRIEAIRPSSQGTGIMNPSPRVERVNPSNQGMSGFAGVGRGGFQSAERGGGFTGKSGVAGGGHSGNARGGFSGRAGGFGARG